MAAEYRDIFETSASTFTMSIDVVDVLLRHPNILQIYGVASSGSIHATVFHGGMDCTAKELSSIQPPTRSHASAGFLQTTPTPSHSASISLDLWSMVLFSLRFSIILMIFRCNSSVYENLLIYSPVVTCSQSANTYFRGQFGRYLVRASQLSPD